MLEAEMINQLAVARSGDQEAFRWLTEPYRRELLVHCYRILGSVEDAEDMVQETLLRGWRRSETFEGRGTLRSWLYKIATNLSLDALERLRPRRMPTATHAAADPLAPLLAPSREMLWLEPLPDTLIDPRPAANPEARYEARESVTLAFLATLQSLPGRQRAVLLLRDLIGWEIGEIAESLSMTPVAVNSALQRARATMKKHESPERVSLTPVDDEQTTTLLAQYVAAWEAADATRLIALLAEDAILTMPPMPTWYKGRNAIRIFLDTLLFAADAQRRFRLISTQANGAPAFAVYERDLEGVYRAAAIQVLAISHRQMSHRQITQIDDFIAVDDRLFTRFGLPFVI